MIRSVKGVGYCSDTSLTARINGRITKPYQKWVSMLERTTSEAYMTKYPTYRDVTVVVDWYDYSNFKNWYDSQFKEDDWELDKDISQPESKQYGPMSCCLIPKDLNYLLVGNPGTVYDLPRGVTFHKGVGKFYAQCNLGDGKLFRKYFEKVDDAVAEYLRVKASVIKSKIEKYSNVVRDDVIEALERRVKEMIG